MTESEFHMKMNQSKYNLHENPSYKHVWNVAKNADQEGINECFCLAALIGQKDLMEFLLTEPSIKVHADIHTSNDYPFAIAYMKNHKDVLDFLINDMKIEKTELIEGQILREPKEEVIEMFAKRDNAKKLKM